MGEEQKRARTKEVHWKAFHFQWLPTLPLCLHPQKAVTLNYNP